MMGTETTPIVTQSPTANMVWLRLSVLLTKTAGTYMVGALMGEDWGNMSGQQHLMIVAAGVVALATAVESFFDKTSARAEQGKAERLARSAPTGNTPVPFQPPIPPQ